MYDLIHLLLHRWFATVHSSKPDSMQTYQTCVSSPCAGADIAMVHRHENGQAGAWQVTDCHGEGFFTPVKDDSQDWTLLSAAVTGSMMSATLVRRMKPCDLDNDIEIKRGLGNFFIFANVSGWSTYSKGFLRLHGGSSSTTTKAI
jgi:hypothetical protein